MKTYNDNYCLMDLSACIRHSYHGAVDQEPLEGRDGAEVKSAAAGFNAFLDLYMTPILEIFQPRQILAAIDRGEDYQLSLLPEYKQNRATRKGEADPVEMGEIDKLKEMVKRFLLQLGATLAGVKGVEADDVVAYLAQGLPGYKQIYTVDTDFLQLIGDGVNADVFLKGELVEIDTGGYKVSPFSTEVPFKQWRLMRSILGKPADNYKGVPGMGAKAVETLMTDLGEEGMAELDRVVRDRDWPALPNLGIEDKYLNKLVDNRQSWVTSYAVASLHPELCWKPRNGNIPKIDWVKRVGSEQGLRRVLRAMKCSDRYKEYEVYLPTQWLVDANNFEEGDIAEFTKLVADSPHLSFDYESWSELSHHEPFLKAAKAKQFVDVLSQKITGCSFNFGENLQHTFYLTVDHAGSANVPMEVLERFLKAIPKDTVVVAQNAPFEITLTKTNIGLELEDVHDTSIMQVYVDENSENRLKRMSKSWLNYDQVDYATVTDGKRMDELSAEHVLSYGCDDSLVTGRIYDIQKIIMLLESTWGFYIENEPLVANVTSHSYIAGNKLDWDVLGEIHRNDTDTYTENMEKLHALMREHGGKASPAAAREFFKADEDFNRKNLREKFKLGKAPAKYMPEGEDVTFSDYWSSYKEARLVELTEATVYTPYVKTVKPKEFVPTKTNLFKLFEKLGFDSTPKSYSMKQIVAWADAHLMLNWEDGTEDVDHKQEFLKSLQAAARNIVKASERSGKSYDRFIAMVNKLLPNNAVEMDITESGDELNIGSPKQKQELLYLKLGLPVRLHSKVQPGSARAGFGVDGSPSTNELAINWALAEDMDGEGDWRVEALNCMKRAQRAKTEIGLFCEPYPLWKHPYDEKIHPSIKDCGAPATKRMSGSSPNIMQVSTKTDLRDIFIPGDDDYVIVGIDWAGQELRLTAGACKDKTMLSAYVGKKEELRDIHSLTASGLAGMKYNEFYVSYMDEEDENHSFVVKVRKQAKMVNFGIVYLITAPALAQRLIVPEARANKMLDDTFKTYPGIKKWQDNTIAEAKKLGYVSTFLGVRKHATNALFSRDKSTRSRQERQLVNYRIQGSAADMLKRLFSMIWKTGVIQQLNVGFILPVHDELVAAVPRVNLAEYIQRVSKLMKLPVPGCVVPMDVDVAISAKSWGQCVEIGNSPTQLDIDRALEKEASS